MVVLIENKTLITNINSLVPKEREEKGLKVFVAVTKHHQ